MILVDSSVWITHFHKKNEELAAYLVECRVLTHPFIIGELALGSIPRRLETLQMLALLPESARARDEEVCSLIERQKLIGTGIGYIDAHLLASACLSGVKLWTLDRRLHEAAVRLGVSGN